MKKVVSLFLAILMILSLSTVASATSTNFEIPTFEGKRFDKVNDEVDHYMLSQSIAGENLSLIFEGNSANLSLELDNEFLEFELLLLPSQFAAYVGNTIIGVCEESTDGYSIASFRIERSALEIGLMEDNLDLVNQTVLFLAIEDAVQNEISYFQVALSIDFTHLYNVVYNQYDDTEYSVSEVEKIEVSYITFSNRSSNVNNSVSTITIEGESDMSDADMEYTESSDELSNAIDDIKDASQYGFVKMTNPKSRSLINGIPDEVYKSGAFFEWKKRWNGWTQRTGYAVYPMQFAGTSNRLHYVMTYRISLDIDYANQEFDISFMITQNCWVMYLVESDEVGIYDSRARLAADPKITFVSNTERGVFTRRYYTIVKADTLIDRAKKIIVGYIPYLGDVATIYETLTSSGDLTKDKWYPYGDNFDIQEDEGKIIQEVSVYAEGLKQINDYLLLKLEGDSISSVSYSFSYNVYDLA